VSFPDFLPQPPHQPSDVEAWAFKEGHRVSEAKAARYAQLHADDPPRRGLIATLRRALRRMRPSSVRRQ
jgi:hypothetical protein